MPRDLGYERNKSAADELARLFSYDELEGLKDDLIDRWTTWDDRLHMPLVDSDAPDGLMRFIDVLHFATLSSETPGKVRHA